MARIYNSAEELIGRTPLLRLNNIEKKEGLSAKLLAKLANVRFVIAFAVFTSGQKRGFGDVWN